jgi:hypothetical protein
MDLWKPVLGRDPLDVIDLDSVKGPIVGQTVDTSERHPVEPTVKVPLDALGRIANIRERKKRKTPSD